MSGVEEEMRQHATWLHPLQADGAPGAKTWVDAPPPSVRAQRRSRGREVQGRAGGKEVGEAGGPDASGPEGCSDGLAFSELGS